MPDSPRLRRLRNDFAGLEKLAAASSIFSFQCFGSPPDFFMLRFKGRGFWRADLRGEVLVRDEHEIHVRLGAAYPRMMPELAWKSPVFHPNVSSNGVVCLGGYSTFWAPSLTLDDLCCMLWDMIRYENFDETSPYNREAAAWARHQSLFRLPIDSRPLRDKLAAASPIDTLLPRPVMQPPGLPSQVASPHPTSASGHSRSEPSPRPSATVARPITPPAVRFLGEVIEAEAVESRDGAAPEILFIE